MINSVGKLSEPTYKLSPQSELEEWLIVDCDDVMGDFASFICNEMNKVGKKASKSDYKEYRFMDYHELSHEQFVKAINDSRAFLNIEPFMGVKEALELIRAKGYKIAIVTARGMFKDAYELTEQWMNTHQLTFDKLFVVDPETTKKSEVYCAFDNAKIIGLVDDASHNLDDAIEKGIPALRIEQPWNVGCKYTKTAKSLFEIAKLL